MRRVALALFCVGGMGGCVFGQLVARITAVMPKPFTAWRRVLGQSPRLVLVGSSSIRNWPRTDTVFASYDVVNAGFGGSCFEDLWELRDTLIYALGPDVLIVYEGDNDLHDGLDEDDILTTADMLLADITRRLPHTKVVMIAPKASLARQKLSDRYLSLNANLAIIAQNHGVAWVDFWSVQHTDEGAIREDLLDADRLHLNDAGYAVWVTELRRQLPWLDPNTPKTED